MTPRDLPRQVRLTVRAPCSASLGILLVACSYSSPTRFFTLDAVAPATALPAAYRGPPLRVRAVHIPPALDRVELVEETAPEQVRVMDFEHWVAPLDLAARQALTQDLAARLWSRAVVAPDAPLPDGGVDLQVDVLSYNIVGRTAVMQAGWRLSGGGATPNPKDMALVTLKAIVLQRGGARTAEGLSTLLGHLADRIVSDLNTPTN